MTRLGDRHHRMAQKKKQNRPPPPPYNDHRPAPNRDNGRTDEIIARFETTPWEAQPSGSKNQYVPDSAERSNIAFALQPRILRNMSLGRMLRDRETQPAWRAILLVRARNIARLMCDGFYWGPQNLVPAGEGIELHMEKPSPLLTRRFDQPWGRDFSAKEWCHKRTYALTDLGTDPEWRGSLHVWGKKPSTVINFDVRDITMDSTRWATAEDPYGVVVYDTRNGPDASFNLVFGQRPLEGWWPWPKASISWDGARDKGI